MKKLIFLSFMLLLSVVIGCKDENDDPNANNTQTGMLGEVGNSWQVTIDNTYDLSAELIAKEGDVRTVEVSYGKLVSKQFKFGFSNNEVVDYGYSQGDLAQPFTMVKFDAKVGDIYTAEIDGVYHYREVTEITTYNIPALNKDIQTIGVYEEIPYETPSTYFGFTIRTIIWYWHPTYGLVCVDVWTDQGDYLEIVFVQIDL
ncbi:MAG: hypothetical protein R2750_05530 [Bacteroidales bacterium]